MSRKLRGAGIHEEGGEEAIDEKPKSLLMSLVSQLRVGMDLSKVTLPTFILEPRSFLEKLSDFFVHSHLILPIGKMETPEQRFMAVLKWYLSGWHLKPKGCKKPYNPILGETFYCVIDSDDFGQTQYIAEQVSHHPPISAFHMANRKQNIIVDGVVFPRSKFLGNSAATILDGQASITLLDRKVGDAPEEYVFNFPSYYVKGVVFGKLAMEVGDKTTLSCAQTGWSAEIEFKMKGMIFGKDQENMVTCTVLQGKTKMYSITGYWDDVMDISPVAKGSAQEIFLDVTTQKKYPLVVAPLEQQEEKESRRLWADVTEALKKDDQDAATAAKTKLEDQQRADAKERKEKGEAWTPKYFSLSNPSDEKSWKFNKINTSLYTEGERETKLQ